MNWYGIEFSVELFVLLAIFGALAIILFDFQHPRRARLLAKLQLRKLRRQDGLFKTGLLLTILFLGLIFFVFGFDFCEAPNGCESKARALFHSSPNEFGDTLAGVAGTLAFLWIIITVMMQSKELRAQRLELKLTREEFRRQRIISEKQINILRDEEQFRREHRANLEFEQLLEDFRRAIEWHGKHKRLCREIWEDVLQNNAENDVEFFLDLFFKVRKVDILSPEFAYSVERTVHLKWDDMISRADAICDIEPRLSSADKIRFQGARIKQIRNYLISFAEAYSEMKAA